jgi:ribose transport system substrate-binding protein
MQSAQTQTKTGRKRGRRTALTALATVGCIGAAATTAFAGGATPAQNLAQFTAKPTSIGSFTPLKTKPPKGKVVVYLGNPEVSNVQVAAGVQQAAAAAGWKYEEVSYNPADPSTFIAAFNTAISKHANYVMEAGTVLPPQVISAATAHHIKIAVDAVDPVAVTGPVIASTGGAAVDYRMGVLTADEFIVASKGSGEAVEEAIPQYPILTTFLHGFQNTLKADCPNCKIDEADVSLTDFAAGNLPKIVVAAVQAHPSAKYIVFDDGPFADSMPSALSAAGISGKVLMGEAGDATDIAGIKTGQDLSWTGYSVPFDSWEMMDAAFRDAEGMTIPKSESIQPTQIITSANAGSIQLFPKIGGWNYPTSGFQQFLKVWGLK